MENLTIEICEDKIKYWTKRKTELEREQRQKETMYRRLWKELAEAAVKGPKAYKETLQKQLSEGV